MKERKTGNFSEQATFAGGCFWCVQGPFDAEAGVHNVEVGYAGGTQEEAYYEIVCSGKTQHRETIHMQFDPVQISYRTMLEIFFRQIDPTDPDGQFADQGFQYTTAVYYHTPEQRTIAEQYIRELDASKKYSKPIATQVVPFTTFFPAEEEHQSYYKKNPLRYQMYKKGSGRSAFIKRYS
ncbi:MAG: peptide-methionine (S)-S-oxide reductase MsrA [Candidatus Kerfeldbacteria bacterium]|nr:peptide-methionine (S)-S-oxide reductase MsrA [Candidatus Kerfeldbacteria bacterium]